MSESTEVVLRPNITKSGPIGQLFKALAAAKKSYKTVQRTRENDFTGSKYADLQDLYDATQGALSENGLTVIQFPIENLAQKQAGAYSMLGHESGEWVAVELLLPAEAKASGGAMKFDAQSVGSAITYASRYSYRGLVGVVGEDDDDGNAASQNETPQPPPKSKQAPPVNKAPASSGAQPRPNEKKAPEKAPEAPAAQSAAPPAAEPGPQPEKTQPAPETPALPLATPSSGVPDKTQFDTFCQHAAALKIPLEKAGLKASKGVQTGAKLKNFILKRAGVKELTELTIDQWNDFFGTANNFINGGTAAELVAKIEEANQ